MKIYFGGSEYFSHSDTLIRSGVKHCSLNFYNLRKRTLLSVEAMHNLLDRLAQFESVAVTFLNRTFEEQLASGEERFSEWAERYLQFCRDCAGFIQFAEAPTFPGSNGEEAANWLKVFLGESLPVAQHVSWDEGLSTPDQDAQTILTPTVIVSGAGRGNIRCSNRVRELVDRGYDVHILNVSSDYVYFNYAATSCDTMEWLAGELHGQLYTFRDGKLKTLNAGARNKQAVIQAAEECGVDPNALLSPVDRQSFNTAINYVNLTAWKKFQDHLLKEDVQEVPEPGAHLELVHHDGEGALEAGQISKEYLPLRCDFCYAKAKCPKMKKGAACSFNFADIFDVNDNVNAFDQSIVSLLRLQYERIQRAANFERAGDGFLDTNLSKEIAEYFRILERVKHVAQRGSRLSVSAKGIQAAGEAATKLASGGILSSLLNNPDK